jgi:hypothetical protein
MPAARRGSDDSQARCQGREARLPSTGVKAPRCQGARQRCVWPSSAVAGHHPHLAPVLGYQREGLPTTGLDHIARGPRRPLAVLQEPAPVLEGGQEGQEGQRIRDTCDRYDTVDTYCVGWARGGYDALAGQKDSAPPGAAHPERRNQPTCDSTATFWGSTRLIRHQ